MNSSASPPTSPASLLRSLARNRELVAQMTWREIAGRYKGSVMGLLWSFLNPVLMLAVYTYVFSVVFQNKWAGVSDTQSGSRTLFALLLFAGMIVHGLFAEVVNRAPMLVVQNVNYVKKVVFPLEVLPAATLGAALFHAGASLLVLLVAVLLSTGTLHATVLLLPLVLAPLAVLALGAGWLLASLGVFVRDIGQTTALFTTVLMFLSPVFYPVAALPPQVQGWMLLNPLTFIIEQTREVLVWGHAPQWDGLALYFAVACAFAWACYAWFQKTRKGFADVL